MSTIAKVNGLSISPDVRTFFYVSMNWITAVFI